MCLMTINEGSACICFPTASMMSLLLGVAFSNETVPLISWRFNKMFSFFLLLLLLLLFAIYLTLMAYSPFNLIPIFWAIMEFSASVIKIRPCQLLLKLEMPHCGQLSVSTNNLQRLHTFFFAMGFSLLLFDIYII